MRRTVLTFGLIAGAIMSVMMVLTIPLMDHVEAGRSEIIGYTTMVLAFLMVFFGVRSYRDNVAGGSVGFGRAFAVGLLITLIACVCYVVTWEIISHTVMTDFVDKYAAAVLAKARASGASQQELAATVRQMADFKKMYSNPFINVAFTFIEPFPVGLVFTLVCAGILSRKRRRPAAGDALPGGVAAI
ncbi:MAG: hypothetical protein JWM27_362 [Gemmatimonadetes bacterium]|nr:hypothetical protein [Gemmatimonadota bacterium]